MIEKVVVIRAWNICKSIASDFSNDWLEKSAEMFGGLLFHLQTMEDRQRETKER